MGPGRFLVLLVGTAASVGGATVLWVSSLSPHDVPFVAPVHPQQVQHEQPVVATPLPAPHVVLKKTVKHPPHVAVTHAPAPVVAPVVRHVTTPAPSKPKPTPVVPPTPTPAPTPTPTPAPAPPAPVVTPVAVAPTTTTTTTTTQTPPSPPPPPTTTPDDNSKPGNGYGDTNHDHTGPPGQNKKDGG
jgi:hypothetical protein